MGDYLRIARVYLRGPAAAVWLFMFVCLLSASLDDGEMARNQGGIVAGVLRENRTWQCLRTSMLAY